MFSIVPTPWLGYTTLSPIWKVIRGPPQTTVIQLPSLTLNAIFDVTLRTALCQEAVTPKAPIGGGFGGLIGAIGGFPIVDRQAPKGQSANPYTRPEWLWIFAPVYAPALRTATSSSGWRAPSRSSKSSRRRVRRSFRMRRLVVMCRLSLARL